MTIFWGCKKLLYLKVYPSPSKSWASCSWKSKGICDQKHWHSKWVKIQQKIRLNIQESKFKLEIQAYDSTSTLFIIELEHDQKFWQSKTVKIQELEF
jgi:hypothetical protein